MMTKRALLAEQSPDLAAHGAVEPEAIRLQFGRLVESPSFRSSKRCRLFLEHAIEHALTPNALPLKEREVGMQVFGREPSYDTAADPVVRVTAGEIRRRLGQYYAEPAHQRELRVELPAGSYTPTFTWPAEPPPATSTSAHTATAAPSSASSEHAGHAAHAANGARDAPGGAAAGATFSPASVSSSSPSTISDFERHAAYARDGRAPAGVWVTRRGIAIVGVVGAVAALALLGALVAIRQPPTTFDRFWGPLIQSKVPVLLCTGSIDVYDLPASLKRAADHAAAASAGGGAGAAGAPESASLFPVDPRQVMRVGAGFVSVADAVAIVRFASLFQERGTPYHVRENRSTSFADLRTSPTVLVGMFSNAWTLQLGADFRFVPERIDGGDLIVIRDRQHPERGDWQVTAPWPKLAIARDYALVSRVFDRATGTLVVSGAGITPYGTAAAAEFLTSPQHLEAALRNLPADWPTRNLQIVLETRVIDGAAAPPHVLATHTW